MPEATPTPAASETPFVEFDQVWLAYNDELLAQNVFAVADITRPVTQGESIALAGASGNENQEPPLLAYEPGFWGPAECGDWMESQGRQWFDTCPVLA